MFSIDAKKTYSWHEEETVSFLKQQTQWSGLCSTVFTSKESRTN